MSALAVLARCEEGAIAMGAEDVHRVLIRMPQAGDLARAMCGAARDDQRGAAVSHAMRDAMAALLIAIAFVSPALLLRAFFLLGKAGLNTAPAVA